MMSGNSKVGSVTITVTKSKTKAPKKTSISTLKAGKKKFVVKWKKQKSISGYQVQYSTDKKFRKGKKTTTIKKSRRVEKDGDRSKV